MSSVDEIQNLTVTVDRALRMVANEVKSEAQIATTAAWSYEKREKELILEKLEEKINIGIEEASILLSLSFYISLLEAEKEKFSLQIERLQQENVWLHEEEQQCEKRLRGVQERLNEISQERDMCRAAYVLRKMNPESCDRIVSEFSKIMTSQGEVQDEVLSPEYENFFSSKVQAMFYLSVQCIKHSEYGLARLLVDRMLEKITSAEGATSPDVASLYEILAMITRREGKLAESLPFLKKSLEIREFCFGKDSVQVSITLNNMSICQSKMTMFRDAYDSCSRALRIKETAHGKDSQDVAKQCHNLALVCTYLGKFSEAHSYFQRAIDIHKNTKPFDEEKLLKTQNSVAMCHLRQNNIEEARTLIYALIDRYHERLLHRKPSPTHDPSIYMIIDAYYKDKRKAIDLLNSVYGVSSINELSLIGKNLSTLYRKLRQDRKTDIIQDWIHKKLKPRPSKSVYISKSASAHESVNSGSKTIGESRPSTISSRHLRSETSKSEVIGRLQATSSTNGNESEPSRTEDSSRKGKMKFPFTYIFKRKP